MTQAHEHTDQYLIEGLAQNNSAIINEIYKTYSPKMCAWIKQNNGDQEQAEDIFQEAIIDVYRKARHQGFILTCPFDAFLFVIVRNKWYSFLKKDKQVVVTNVDDNGYTFKASTTNDANKIMQYELQHQLLIQKLETLQQGCTDLLKLSWNGMSMEEVATKLNMTYAYVRKKKSLCMATLIASIKNSNQYNQLSFIT